MTIYWKDMTEDIGMAFAAQRLEPTEGLLIKEGMPAELVVSMLPAIQAVYKKWLQVGDARRAQKGEK